MNTVTRKLPTVARICQGLVFATFGLNKLVPFIRQPPMAGPPAEFFGGLMASGYILPLVAGTEIAAGLMLLTGRFTPLALTLLAPIIVNIVAFHIFLAPAGLPVALVVLALELYLAWVYRDAFAAMLRAESVPRATAVVAAPEDAAALAAE
jgi:uncharacterized membrane protein YphA (DoxX/SURF4 family)